MIDNWDNYGKTAVIEISTTSDCSSSADCDDFNSCTIDRCSDGNCIHTPIDCNECGANVTILINANEKVEKLSWTVENINKKRVIISSNTTLEANQTYVESKCLEFSDYSFIISYAANDTESNNITYKAQSEDSTLFQGSTNEYLEEEILFTICSSNADCLDYDGCSEDFLIRKPKFVKITLITAIVLTVNGLLSKLLPITTQKKLLGAYKTMIMRI